jgi:hypothetical protein
MREPACKPISLSCLLAATLWTANINQGIAAAFLDSDSLFLAPSLVPTAIYDPINISPGGSHVFSAADVPGATDLLGIRILPVLEPNPNSAEGEYQAADLAGITVQNYSSFYAFEPNQDYFATTIEGDASTATFEESGSYYVQLHTSNGSTESDSYFRVQADDFLAEDPAAGVKDATGPERKITLPKTELTVISDGDPNDNGFLANAQNQLPDAVKAKTIQEAIDAIKKYYNDHGKKKFEVKLMGHGRSGSIKIGTERINNEAGGTMSVKDFQKAVDPYLNSIHFVSCSTAADAAGEQFLKDIKASIPIVTAYDGPVTAARTYFNAGAGTKNKRGADVPDSGSVLLLLVIGASVLLWQKPRRMSRAEAD